MIDCNPDLKTPGKAANPQWFWHGIFKEWIPNLKDEIRKCEFADEHRKPEAFLSGRYFKPVQPTPKNVVAMQPAPRTLRDEGRSQKVRTTEAQRGRKGESILETVQRAVAAKIIDHEAQEARKKLAVEALQRPSEGQSPQMYREWVKATERFQAYGYQPYGPKGVCIFTGLQADTVDHTPSLSYLKAHGGSDYGGRKLLVACNYTANAHKADFGSECLWQCAQRIAYRASVAQKDPQKASAIINGVQATWPRSDYPCPCSRCNSVDSETRRQQIANDPVTKQPVVRSRQ